jgi:hypothetical protein
MDGGENEKKKEDFCWFLKIHERNSESRKKALIEREREIKIGQFSKVLRHRNLKRDEAFRSMFGRPGNERILLWDFSVPLLLTTLRTYE